MQIPDEFKRLTQCFWQGSDREVTNRQEWIEKALKLCSAQQQVVIKDFLTNLLSRQPSTDELQKVWGSGGSPYGIHDHAIRSFLEDIRDMIH
jgi:hypothetical protein